MGKIKRYKNSIERYLSSERGQRFFNFAYSIGAAVVIWGALFKILHLPGGSTLLSIGMGTEVIMFILTAFDRPPREYHWEEVFPVLGSHSPEDRPEFNGGQAGGGVIIGSSSANADTTGNNKDFIPSTLNIPADATPSEQYVAQIAALSAQMDQLRQTTEALNHVSETLLESYRAITENSEDITRCSTGYVEQMQNLNRNISGLNTIYEIQLKSVSSQIDSIDRVNKGIKDIRDMYETTSANSQRYCEETEKMTHNMQQLNNIYEKMLTAMTMNMYRPMGTPSDMQPMTSPEDKTTDNK